MSLVSLCVGLDKLHRLSSIYPSWVVALVSADERSDASIPKFDRRILLTLVFCVAFLI